MQNNPVNYNDPSGYCTESKSNVYTGVGDKVPGPNGKLITKEYDELTYGGRYSKKELNKTPQGTDLPQSVVVEENGVRIEHVYAGNDHANPVHLHVNGGGPVSHIGPNGKPTKGFKLTPQQKRVIDNNLPVVKKTIKKLQKWFKQQFK